MKLLFLILLLSLSILANAKSSAVKIMSVGSITITACKDAKVLADWYSRFGIETQEYEGIYFAQIDTAAGPLVFGIHPKAPGASEKCSGNIAITYSVENYEESISTLASKGITPERTEKEEYGKFAYFHDPDGNELKIWGQ